MQTLSTNTAYELPIPGIYDRNKVGDFFTPLYEDLINSATQYREQMKIAPRRLDKVPVALTIIDQQKTFCLADGELSIAPASVKDTANICEFIYKNMRVLSDIIVTLDRKSVV